MPKHADRRTRIQGWLFGGKGGEEGCEVIQNFERKDFSLIYYLYTLKLLICHLFWLRFMSPFLCEGFLCTVHVPVNQSSEYNV